MELSEWRAATEQCFAKCELSDAAVADADAAALATHVRAVLGRSVCAAKVAMERDPRVSAPSTLRALLAALTRMQQAMQLITDRHMEVREQLYWLTFNASVRMFNVCEVRFVSRCIDGTE